MTATTIISRDTKDALLAMIEANCIEPVTMNEVYLAQKRHLKRAFSTVAKAMSELVEEGSLVTRPELVTEGPPKRRRGNAAMMYWPASKGRTIPIRKTDIQFPGVSRASAVGASARGRIKPKYRRRPAKDSSVQTGQASTVTRRPAKDSEMQTGNRIERLEKRVAELEAVISSFRKILN